MIVADSVTVYNRINTRLCLLKHDSHRELLKQQLRPTTTMQATTAAPPDTGYHITAAVGTTSGPIDLYNTCCRIT